jgi:hypothetical protein
MLKRRAGSLDGGSTSAPVSLIESHLWMWRQNFPGSMTDSPWVDTGMDFWRQRHNASEAMAACSTKLRISIWNLAISKSGMLDSGAGYLSPCLFLNMRATRGMAGYWRRFTSLSGTLPRWWC